MSYEEYMQSVLGYSGGLTSECNCNSFDNYDLYETDNNYSYRYPNVTTFNRDYQDSLNALYPDVYKLLYPMVVKCCNINKHRELNKVLLDELTDEIYRNFDSNSNNTREENLRSQLKNGDVRNPNAKEVDQTQEKRQANYLLKDLIQILLLREFGKHPIGRPPYIPNFPPRPPVPPPVGPGMGRPPYRPRPY